MPIAFRVTAVLAIFSLLCVQAPPSLLGQTAAPPPTPEQLDQLLAPIALYPDSLLAQITTASTNPQEILDVNNWLAANQSLSDADLSNAAQQQGFDPAQAQQLVTLAPNSYAEIVLMPALVARLRERAPGIRLRFVPFGADLAETGVNGGTTSLVFGRIVDAPDNLVVQHLLDDGLACVVRRDHPQIGDKLTKRQYERLRHVNVLPPGRLRIGLFQALQKQNLRRDVAVSVTHFLAVPEMIAVTDYCATLPRLICRHLASDPRLKVLPSPVDLGRFPLEMAWHARYRNDPAHRWLRTLVAEVAQEIDEG